MPRSRVDQPGTSGPLELGERLPAPRLRLFQRCPERMIVPDRVELRTPPESGRHEVAFRDRAPNLAEAGLILPDIAQQPSDLEDRFRILLNLQGAEHRD